MISIIQATRMIAAAKNRDGAEILPYGGYTLNESFREYPDSVVLFYNVPSSKTTHCVVERSARNCLSHSKMRSIGNHRLIVPFHQREEKI
ncbi:hypothetical protein ES705_17570 [subsurface metagenome]